MTPRPPRSPLFPYTTLFRSAGACRPASTPPIHGACRAPGSGSQTLARACVRSEEHTSELQSRPHLVCRLLLEKKKKKIHCQRQLIMRAKPSAHASSELLSST